jgi:hypothetical protein
MGDLQAVALDGSRTVLERKNVETFATSLRGALLEPGHPGYDEGRILWCPSSNAFGQSERCWNGGSGSLEVRV